MLRWRWGGAGWGGVGDVNVRVNLLRFLMLRWWWGGVGWGGVGDVDVRVNLLRFLMLRWWWGGAGWGGVGDVNVRVNLLRFLMLRWWWGGVGWGGVGDVNVRVNLLRHNRCCLDVLQKNRAKEFACQECGFDSLLQNVAMEIHPHVQTLGESHGDQTARDVKMTVRTAEHAWTSLKQKLRFA